MKFGIVVFPGSNCDHDTYHVVKHVLGSPCTYLWHKDESLQDCDVVILPGGFSYGDYLRTGAIARFSPLMKNVAQFAGNGGFVLGICNGFQILLEMGLLPGAMLKNTNLRFICKYVHVRVEENDTPFTNKCSKGEVLRIPIAHHDGNYYADEKTLRLLKSEKRIILQYSTPEGEITSEANPNGSVENIAAICNSKKNVFGMMPHPERSAEEILGSTDGRKIFESLLAAANI